MVDAHCRHGPGDFDHTRPHIPAHVCELETPALPRFPGCPYALALLTDPGRITASSPICGRCDVACWTFKAIGSYMFVISGLNHTARAFAVYASQPGSPHVHARLATDRLARPWSRGTLIRWATMQSFWITLIYPSPLPELRLAQAGSPRVVTFPGLPQIPYVRD